jgi:hypothetical protein
MARALLGYVGNNNEQALALEVARLRHRVAQLETQIAELPSSILSCTGSPRLLSRRWPER